MNDDQLQIIKTSLEILNDVLGDYSVLGTSVPQSILDFYRRSPKEQKDFFIKAQNKDVSTPLHYAAQFNFVEAIKRIVNSVPDILTLDCSNMPPIWTLLRTIDAQDSKGNTPLYTAAEHGHLEAVDKLLELGANTNVTNNQGETLLHAAAIGGNPQIIKKLIELKLDIDAIGLYNNTPLYYAAVMCHKKALEEFLKYEPNIYIREINGGTLLHSAALGGDPEIVRRFIALGLGQYINEQDRFGNTPVYYASLRNYRDHLEVIDILLDLGADTNVINNKGETFLHAAAIGGNSEIIKRFIRLGLDTNAQDHRGNISIFRAAKYGHQEVVEELLKYKPKIKIKNHKGKTLLHVATQGGNPEIVKICIRLGIDINAQDDDGRTALYYADSFNETEIVKILLKYGAVMPTAAAKEDKEETKCIEAENGISGPDNTPSSSNNSRNQSTR